MNKQEADILNILAERPSLNQRALSEESGRSLGLINKALKQLKEDGFLGEKNDLTAKAKKLIQKSRPKRAVILAAGFGMRMVPINLTTPKAMLEVKGERLIERLIRQLREADVEDITVVAGFMVDEFEYLIDDFGIKLVVNDEYAAKNNMHSMALAAQPPGNLYIVPCDLWCEENPFRKTEVSSWYMMADSEDPESGFRVNRKEEIVRVSGESGQRMVGIAYILDKDWDILCDRIRSMDQDNRYDGMFWEAALFEAGSDRMSIPARVVSDSRYVEINTYEQLRDLDSGSGHLSSVAIDTIAKVFGIRPQEVTEISVLKKGMTNRSFLFTAKGGRYIMRIPGEGTDLMINRREEAEVFKTISGKGICDDPVYIDPDSGYKITAFLEGVRTCDPADEADLQKCMKLLRKCHEMKLQVPHTFDLFGKIEYYEKLWNGKPSIYRDYEQTKSKVLELKAYVDAQPREFCLSHIDAVPDNFLFYQRNGKEELQLTDWEYAGMQDPHVDIVMFANYSLYTKTEIDRLIDIYFEGRCPEEVRTKIYCYEAIIGLLWSNWCEYKRQLGVEFGEYSLRQYRYAKEFYRYAKERI